MSDVIYTVLVSPAFTGPWCDRRFAPIEAATLHVGGSAKWVFTSLTGDPRPLSVRPSDPQSEAAALVVGLAAGLAADSWLLRHLRGHEPSVDVCRDEDLVQRAVAAIAGNFRLSIAGESLRTSDVGAELIRGHAGIDADVLCRATPAQNVVPEFEQGDGS